MLKGIKIPLVTLAIKWIYSIELNDLCLYPSLSLVLSLILSLSSTSKARFSWFDCVSRILLFCLHYYHNSISSSSLLIDILEIINLISCHHQYTWFTMCVLQVQSVDVLFRSSKISIIIINMLIVLIWMENLMIHFVLQSHSKLRDSLEEFI